MVSVDKFDVFMKKGKLTKLGNWFQKKLTLALLQWIREEKKGLSQDISEYWFCLSQGQNSKIYLSTLDRV